MSDPVSGAVPRDGATWTEGPVTVEVPATTANLGPGYDCLGLALELTDTLVGEVTEAGLVVEVDGEGAGDVALDETHLVVRAVRRYFEEVGVQPPGLRLHCTNRIPHSRGLGSSSAAIVGGLVLARALLAADVRSAGPDLLALAAEMEGHPDNVAPALLGGLAICGQRGDEVWSTVHEVTGRVVVVVPPHGVRTELARGLLPDSVPHAVAAQNSGRAALLGAHLVGSAGRPSSRVLLLATQDFLHQEYRRPAMPDSLDLVAALRALGVPAVISGAGPTVLAFVCDDEKQVWYSEQEQVDLVRETAPDGWLTLEQAAGGPGARVLA